MSATNYLRIKPDVNDSEKILLEKIATGFARGFGEYGTDAIFTTDTYSGQTWCAFTVLSTAAVSFVTGLSSGNMSGATLAAGTTVTGLFTQIELLSGKAIAYRAF